MRNNQPVFWAIVAGLLLMIGACKSEPNEIVGEPEGVSYYPLDSGFTRIYSFDSISFNDNTGSIDTFRFTLKEEVIGIIEGQLQPGHTQILRSVKPLNGLIWEPRSTLFVLRSPNNIQVVEDNNRFVKLTIPLGNTLSWNGNMYNNLGRRTFTLQFKNQPYSLGDTVYESCAQVQEANIKNAIEEFFVRSVYASNIGLIDFTNIYLNKQSTGTSGYVIRQQLISAH